MARPLKVGLEYFPHDVDASSDEKIEYLRAIHKNDGYVFYFMLLERIYRTNEGKLFIDEITSRILAKKMGISRDKFSKILKDCIKVSLFDKTEFENNSHLTSQGILKRFIEIQSERERKRSYYKKNKSVLDVENTGETLAETTGEKGGESTQSKEKEIKVKKSKVDIYTPILNHWNTFANKFDLQQVIRLTDKRKASISKRTTEKDFDLEKILQMISNSPFLKGQNDKGWKVDFDFIFLNENNYLKILEGKYNNEPIKQTGGKRFEYQNGDNTSFQVIQ